MKLTFNEAIFNREITGKDMGKSRELYPGQSLLFGRLAVRFLHLADPRYLLA
jgi:hypothetical protein